MCRFLQKHLSHVVFGHGVVVFLLLVGSIFTFTFHGSLSALLASATSSLSSSRAIMYFSPHGESTLPSGDTADIDLNINAKIPVNAIGATITYPVDSLEIVGISKKNSFMDLWTEDTIIKEGSGEVHFSGGTTAIGGLTGTGTVLTLSVRAKRDARAGDAKVSIADLQILAADGRGTALDGTSRSFSYNITQTEPAQPPPSGGSATLPAQPQAPAADLNSDGRITIVDMSILAVHILMPYDPHYDLDTDGKIGLSDLSILFARM